jgi:hypothetical protein
LSQHSHGSLHACKHETTVHSSYLYACTCIIDGACFT